jgi:hypothetical protein
MSNPNDEGGTAGAGGGGNNSDPTSQQTVELRVENITQLAEAIAAFGDQLTKAQENTNKMVQMMMKQSEANTKTTVEAIQTALTSSSTTTTKALTDVLTEFKKESSDIDQNLTSIHDMYINLNTRAGLHLFKEGSSVPENWKKVPVDTKKENKEKLLRALGLLDSKGYLELLNVPTSGTGRMKASPKTLASGKEVADFDLGDRKHIVNDKNKLSTKDVAKWVHWYNGKADCKLEEPDPKAEKIQKMLDTSSTDTHIKLANLIKGQLRMKSVMMHLFLQGLITEDSYHSFEARKAELEYKKEADDTKLIDGLMLLWMILETLKPGTVIDARELETIIDTATLMKNGNDVRQLISTMQAALLELRRKHGEEAYSETRFVQAMFTALLTSTNEDFLRWVSDKKTSWMSGDDFTLSVFLTKAETLYKNSKQEGTWEKKSNKPGDSQQILALKTRVKKLENGSKSPGGSGGGDDSGNGKNMKNGEEMAGPPRTSGWSIPKVRTVNVGRYITYKGKKHEWCADHRPRDKSFDGLYMQCNDGDRHNHEKWLADKKKRKAQASLEDTSAKSAKDDEKTVSFEKDTSSSAKKQLSPAWKKGKAMLTNCKVDTINDLVELGLSHESAKEFLEKNTTGDF